MTEIEYKNTIIYKHFFAPGIEYYYPTLWGHHSCRSLEEAYRKKQELLAWAKKEDQTCAAIVRAFNKQVNPQSQG